MTENERLKRYQEIAEEIRSYLDKDIDAAFSISRPGRITQFLLSARMGESTLAFGETVLSDIREAMGIKE